MADEIKLFNTLGKTQEIFSPVNENKVLIYHCGPTLYWTQHIGNLRAAFVGDIVNRTMRYAGYDVTFVRNYTDVGHLSGDNEGDADTGEDRMAKAATREGATPEEIAKKYQLEFDTDLERLNIQTPEHRPHATEHIEAMIALVQDLLDKECTYQTDLAIYFDTSKAQDYYKLSGQKAESLEGGAGTGEVQDNAKRNHTDFALWFFKKGAHKHALQTWENPFSDTEGFPGWHIECSAMIRDILGSTIDIHLGGVEHVPIHHTNEIAQSECANNAPLAHYWLHNEHLLVDGGKMSKSGGTAYYMLDIMSEGYDPLDLRYFFLQAHYRSKQNFTWDALDAARTARQRLHERVSSLPDGGIVDPHFKTKFQEKLYDDFNTAGALAVLSDVLKSDMSDADKRATILSFDEVLGLDLGVQIDDIEIPQEVQKLLDERNQARSEKDWHKSDQLRDKIASHGYDVHDTPDGQTINKK
jgi:cysteinyl-tRNA synthetase